MKKNGARLKRFPVEHFVSRSAVGLAVLVLAAAGFTVLLALAQTGLPPLLAVDRQVAAWLNDVVAASPLLVGVLNVVSDLGGSPAS